MLEQLVTCSTTFTNRWRHKQLIHYEYFHLKAKIRNLKLLLIIINNIVIDNEGFKKILVKRN